MLAGRAHVLVDDDADTVALWMGRHWANEGVRKPNKLSHAGVAVAVDAIPEEAEIEANKVEATEVPPDVLAPAEDESSTDDSSSDSDL